MESSRWKEITTNWNKYCFSFFASLKKAIISGWANIDYDHIHIQQGQSLVFKGAKLTFVELLILNDKSQKHSLLPLKRLSTDWTRLSSLSFSLIIHVRRETKFLSSKPKKRERVRDRDVKFSFNRHIWILCLQNCSKVANQSK